MKTNLEKGYPTSYDAGPKTAVVHRGLHQSRVACHYLPPGALRGLDI